MDYDIFGFVIDGLTERCVSGVGREMCIRCWQRDVYQMLTERDVYRVLTERCVSGVDREMCIGC